MYETVVLTTEGFLCTSAALISPSLTVPFASLRNNRAAISKAFWVLSQLTPFSKRLEASVRLAWRKADFLTLVPSKIADSKITSVVSSSTSEFLPPITPAIITGFWPSVIIISFGSKSTSLSFSKVSFSPFLAFLTSNLPSLKVRAS